MFAILRYCWKSGKIWAGKFVVKKKAEKIKKAKISGGVAAPSPSEHFNQMMQANYSWCSLFSLWASLTTSLNQANTLCLNALLLLVVVLPLKQHIMHHFAAFAVYITGTCSTILLWFTWCAYRIKMSVSGTTWNNWKKKRKRQPLTTSFHSNAHTHTQQPLAPLTRLSAIGKTEIVRGEMEDITIWLAHTEETFKLRRYLLG